MRWEESIFRFLCDFIETMEAVRDLSAVNKRAMAYNKTDFKNEVKFSLKSVLLSAIARFLTALRPYKMKYYQYYWRLNTWC